MSDFVPRPTGRITWWFGFLALGLFCCIGGCGKTKEQAQQGTGKKYEVAGEDTGAVPSDSTAAGGAAAGNLAGAVPSKDAVSNGAAAAGQNSAVDVNRGSAPTDMTQPPPLSADQLESITVPDGTPAELLAFIDRWGRRISTLPSEMQGQPRAAVMGRMQQIFEALLSASEKILASPDADQAARMRAIDTKAGAMSVLSQIVPDGNWSDKVKEFGAKLASDKDPEVAAQGRVILFGVLLGDLRQGQSRDYEALMTQLKSLLQLEARADDVYAISMQSVQVLRDANQNDKAHEAFGLIAAAFKDNKDPKLAHEAARMAEQMQFMDTGMEAKLNAAVLDRKGAADEFFAEMTKMLQSPDAGSLTLQKVARYISTFEQTSHYDLARKLCDLLDSSFQQSQDESLEKSAQEVTRRARRRLDLIGKPLTLNAHRLDGGSLDLSPYKGKVVAVVFFASADPGSQQENLNLKSAYEKYHDQGFDVIGVSLDRDPAALKQYLDQSKLPWVIVTNDKLIQQLGVEMIPFCLLLDREGKVSDIYTQGTALNKKLADLLGPPASSPDVKPPAKAAPADQSLNQGSRRLPVRDLGFVAFDAPVPTEPTQAAPSQSGPPANRVTEQPTRRIGEPVERNRRGRWRESGR